MACIVSWYLRIDIILSIKFRCSYHKFETSKGADLNRQGKMEIVSSAPESPIKAPKITIIPYSHKEEHKKLPISHHRQ